MATNAKDLIAQTFYPLFGTICSLEPKHKFSSNRSIRKFPRWRETDQGLKIDGPFGDLL